MDDNRMVGLIEFIAKSLVENVDAVKITATDTPNTLIVELSVAKEDMGRVIGRQGRIAKAIRTVVSAATPRDAKFVRVEIADV